MPGKQGQSVDAGPLGQQSLCFFVGRIKRIVNLKIVHLIAQKTLTFAAHARFLGDNYRIFGVIYEEGERKQDAGDRRVREKRQLNWSRFYK